MTPALGIAGRIAAFFQMALMKPMLALVSTVLMLVVIPLARECRPAVTAVNHDHRMIEGFDAAYHLEDGHRVRVDHHAQVADPSPA